MSTRKSRLIPFSWTPAAWGLRGPQREEAEAAYYYDGYDLDIKLAEIRNRDDPFALKAAKARVEHKYDRISDLDRDLLLVEADPTLKSKKDRAFAKLQARLDNEDISPLEFELAAIDLDDYDTPEEKALAILKARFDHKDLSSEEYDAKCIEIEHPEDGADRELALLESELRHHKIEQHDYEKARATILEEPWIGIVDQGFDPGKGLNGVFFEFDWNEYWIVYLRMNGYQGMTDEQLVDQWFGDVCRAQSLAPMTQGAGGTIIPFSGRIVNRTGDE